MRQEWTFLGIVLVFFTADGGERWPGLTLPYARRYESLFPADAPRRHFAMGSS